MSFTSRLCSVLIHSPLFTDFIVICRVLPANLRRGVVLTFLAMLVQALFEVGSILAISFLGMSIAAPERLQTNRLTAWIFPLLPDSFAIADEPRQLALFACILTTVFIIGKNLVMSCSNLAFARLGCKIGLFAGESIFRCFLYSSYADVLSGDSQAMFQALSWRSSLASMVTELLEMYSYLVVFVTLIGAVFVFTPGLILAILSVIGFVAFVLYRGIKRKVEEVGAQAAELGRQTNKVTLNAMNGIRELLIYRQQNVFQGLFRESCIKNIPRQAFLDIAPSIPSWILECVGFLAIVLTFVGMYGFLDSSMAQITAVLTMLMLVAWRILPLLNRMLGIMVRVRAARHMAMDCLKFLQLARQSSSTTLPDPDPDFTFAREIRLDGVSFTYPGAETESLHQISMAIKKGEKIGIIGQSGAGKSSLANILAGLVEPVKGELFVDDKAFDPARLAAYRQKVGYVPQSPYIMAGSIAENVAFSQWGKPWDEQRVREVCQMAEFEIAEQRGIDASLGQGGAGLSGGQAQRLSIARALYAGPDLLILDEATSALDSGIEAAIMHTIYGLQGKITTVIIAHRLTTVERCDRVLWLKNGQIVMLDRPEVVLPAYEKAILPEAGQGTERDGC